ncbi:MULTISPECIES: hypothetical protein [Streptomyces]|uniref:PH domain-containing protein n=2 Tax=Streptomyces TaxID=1883 RepID=A0A646KCV3_STRJU|nr:MULTISPECIES: hypothetical protein [Streptomyces]MQS35776.1 hypothetical protein [Streptomyces katsurahamanus]MQT00063.1 hypothetical protein [Streptomyces jumonjinensis]
MAMAEPEFRATGVRIERWPRSLTKAGQVLIRDGKLELLTSYGRVIDSAPIRAVRAGRAWFTDEASTALTVNGKRYRLTMGQRNRRTDPQTLTGRFLKAVHGAGAAED